MTRKGQSKEKADEVVKALGTKGEWTGEITATRKDGSKFCASVSANMVKDEAGKPICMLSSFKDITESRNLTEVLKSSEERLRILFESAPDGYYLSDLKGTFIDGNKAAEKITGYTRTELIGKSFLKLKLLPRSQILKAAKLLALNAAGRSTGPDELVLNRKDGTQVQVEIRTHTVRINDQTLVLGIARDITERRKAEQTLKESEEKYKSLVELAPDGIVAVNAEGIVTSANRSFLTLVGYDSEEIVGKPFTELKTSLVEDTPKFQEMFSSLLNGEPLSPVEFLYVRRDGTSRWAEVHPGLLIKDGNPVGAQVVMRDVSERKNAERLVQESQKKFEQLFMSNPEATVYLDPNKKVLNVNPRFTELFGYSLDEVRGKHINDVVATKNMMKEAKMLDEKAVEGYVYHDTVRMRKDGSLVPVSISAAPILIQGRLTGYIGVYKDISQLKKAEKELRKAMKEFQAVNEKLRVVGGLTRHDVNNKLTAVTGYTYLARNKLPGNSEVLVYLKQIEASIEQTVQIFDFAKTYEALGVEELVYIDVEKTVNEAASLFPHLKDIKVMNECHDLIVLADSLLRTLFYNLIDNSLKYGEKLSLIKVYYKEENGDHLNLIYEDDGVGIPHVAKPKLFDEGYTTGKGSGYGLYLVKRMMEVYGWTIQETGTPGKGAQFTITIPKTNPNGKENYRLDRKR